MKKAGLTKHEKKILNEYLTSGDSARTIAERYGVSMDRIYYIARRRRELDARKLQSNDGYSK